jgi:hypothetical protein
MSPVLRLSELDLPNAIVGSVCYCRVRAWRSIGSEVRLSSLVILMPKSSLEAARDKTESALEAEHF